MSDFPSVVAILRVENGDIVQVNQCGVVAQYVARDALGAIEIAAYQYNLNIEVLGAK